MMYSIDEIVAASEKLFGRKYFPALVAAALKSAKVTMTSKEEAIKIVEKFANRRVGE